MAISFREIAMRAAACFAPVTAVLVPDANAEPPNAFQRILALVHGELRDAPVGCLRFFDALFSTEPYVVATVRDLARRVDMVPNTLASRFARAGLPMPKHYVGYVQLIHAGELFRRYRCPVKRVATAVGYSSARTFDRQIRTRLGMTARAFGDSYDGDRMVARFWRS